MKPTLKLLCAALLLGASPYASAWGNNGWDWNEWPVWTPMYWMEEMVDDNDWYGGGPYGPGYGGYGYAPYGYGPGYGGYGPGYGAPAYGYGGFPYGRYGNPYVNPWR